MKKSLGLILVITFIVTLMGCSNTTQIVSHNPQTSVKQEYTKDDAIEIFKKYKDFNNYEIADKAQLTYVGDGAVTISIRKVNTNEVIDYKIIFSHEEPTSVNNFKVMGEKQVK